MQAGYRHDIDGLRALSILAVVLFHGGVDRFGGGFVGVDVFFVISGFLITGLLLREAESTGGVGLGGFYARRIRRLLPMSATVTVTTLLAGVWLIPPVARDRLVSDAWAATLYVANWRYADQATAYSDTEVTDSLLVHYWSLAIEEQFYVLWPLLIITAVLISRRVGADRLRPVLGVLLFVLVVVSFVASVVLTERRGTGAYYPTHTRLWEMGVGAALALVAHRIPRWSTRVLDLIGVGGLAMIAWAALTFDARTPFPGSAAALPVLGCAAVIVAGFHGGGGVSRALTRRPLPLLGRLSYAWYLWHWPAIGIGLLLRDRHGWSASEGRVTAVAIGVSLLLAWGSHHLIENPIRNAPALRATVAPNVSVGAALTVVPLVAGLALLLTVDRGEGEVVLAGPAGERVVAIQTPAQAAEDVTLVDPECHVDQLSTEVRVPCLFGDPEGTRTIVLLGDSHARQWVDVLDELGRREGWRVHAFTKSACSIIDVPVYLPRLERPYEECETWRRGVQEVVAGLGPVDQILLGRAAGYRHSVMDGDAILDPDEIGPVWSAGVERSLTRFTALAPDVRILTDPPWLAFKPPECLSEHGEDPSGCDYELAPTLRDRALTEIEGPVVARFAGASHVDPVPLVCTTETCSVISSEGIVTHRDSHHLTRMFTLSIADEFAALLAPVA